MLTFLAQLKSWAWAICAALIGALLFALKFLADSRERWKDKARRAEAQIEYDDAVDEADAEISAEYTDIRERDSKENLTDANSW